MKVSNEKRIKIHMLRDCDLDKITDGKRYQLSDMVKADCDDCKGCSACCHDMGNSIVLDPLDFHRIATHLGLRFEAMLGDKIDLNVVDGIILPNLRMNSEKEGAPSSRALYQNFGKGQRHRHPKRGSPKTLRTLLPCR